MRERSSDDRAYDINQKEVRYEITKEVIELVKRPVVEKRENQNQVEIVKTVWFGDVVRVHTDGTADKPVVIE